jgi:hypothetical protein
MSNSYSSTRDILCLDDADPLRLRVHKDRIFFELVPLLSAMENNEAEILPAAWLISVAEVLAGITSLLQTTIDGIQDMYVTIILFIKQH